MLVVVDLLKLLSLLMIAEEVVSESCAEKHLKKIASKTVSRISTKHSANVCLS